MALDITEIKIRDKVNIAGTEITSVETTLTGGNSALPRADAVKAYVDGLLNANDAMQFKGTLGTGGTVTALPTTYSAGWTYRVITAGTYVGVVTEVGDLIIAVVDRAGSGNQNSDWTIVQTNIDGAVIGPVSAVSANVARFNGTSGKSIQDSGVAFETTLTTNSDAKSPTSKAVATYVTGLSYVTSVSGTAPIASSGGTTPAISISAATQSAAGSMSSADKTKLDGIASGAQVNVATNLAQGTRTTTTVPVTSSTGTSATLDIATTSLAGVMSSADKTKLDGIATGATANTGTVTSVGLTAGTGISLSGTNPITSSGTITVTNSAPDQTVALTGAGSVSITGTYPNFTITGSGGASGDFLPLTGGTLTGTLTSRAIAMQNYDITGINALSFNDPGPNEGISWTGGNFSIYESPNDLSTNSAGNLQFVSGGVRRATINTSGQLELPVATGTSPLSVSSTTVVTNLNADLLDGLHEGSFLRSDASDDFSGWLRATSNNGLYVDGTNAQLNMDLDASSNTFNVRGVSNNNIFSVSAAGNNVLITKNGHASGADDYHLELLSPNTGTEVSLRFHQSQQWYQQIRARSDGFHFTQGHNNTYRDIFGANIYGSALRTDSTNAVYNAAGRLAIRSESVDQVAEFAAYGMYLPKTSQTAGLYVESPIEARTGIRLGTNAAQGTIIPTAWAGGGSYPGYSFTGGNTRFGFSSSGGVVDVYADGNFYATDSSHLVWHAGNDGSGSGLDADLLDGLQLHTGRNNEANKVVRTDGNGYIQAGWINSTSGNNTTVVPDKFYGSQDDYIRYYDRPYTQMYLGNTYKYSTSRIQHTADSNYWVGTMGWGTTDLNTVFEWGSGFFDTWSSPANRPSSLDHWVGVQALHYTAGGTKYGWQMAMGNGDSNEFYVRGQWGSSPGSWTKIINSGNIGSQNVDSVDGQNFSYSNNSNSPTYLWATDSNGSSYLAARGSISVNYANSAGSAGATGSTAAGTSNGQVKVWSSGAGAWNNTAQSLLNVGSASLAASISTSSSTSSIVFSGSTRWTFSATALTVSSSGTHSLGSDSVPFNRISTSTIARTSEVSISDVYMKKDIKNIIIEGTPLYQPTAFPDVIITPQEEDFFEAVKTLFEKINVYTFSYKGNEDSNPTNIGFMAQEIEEILEDYPILASLLIENTEEEIKDEEGNVIEIKTHKQLRVDNLDSLMAIMIKYIYFKLKNLEQAVAQSNEMINKIKTVLINKSIAIEEEL